jgi:hypothetical protein
MSSAGDCERGLEPLKTHKACINESLTSLAQCKFAHVEIIQPQLMTARKDLNPQEYIKPVLTSLYCPLLFIWAVTRSDAFRCAVDQCWVVETFCVSLRILCYARG